jgi:molybdopterin biosynthesis enzyme
MNAPRPPLLSLDDALELLLASVQPLGSTESISTFDADGRVLAEDIASELQVPAFDNSAMDGYAVRLSDLKQGDAAPYQWERLREFLLVRLFRMAQMPWSCKRIARIWVTVQFVSTRY